LAAGVFALAVTVAGAGPGEADPRQSESDYAFVLTTDYWSAAYYSTIQVNPPRVADISIGSVSTDAVAHYDHEEDMVFVVNRYLADNIQIVDPGQDFATIGQYSVGNGSNPHDMRLVSADKAYVSRYEWKTLLVVNPYSGAVLDSIDLSPVADADGIPEMDRMAVVGDRLFVTLNSINHTTWEPEGPGKVAVIDVAADTLIDADPGTPGVQAIELELPNPYSRLRYDPWRGQLVVGCLGSWSTLDGGVETIDPLALECRGVLIAETELGGDVSDVCLFSEDRGYAVVMDPAPWPDNYARLVAFDLGTGQVTDTLFAQTSGMGSSLAGIEINTQGELYLCDRDATQPGVRIYDTSTHELVEFIDVGLPPQDITFVQPPPLLPSGEGDRRGFAQAVTLGQNYPNPFNPETVIPFALAEGSAVRLEIFDIRGRRVTTLLDGWFTAGSHAIRWSGTNDRGSESPPGVFFYRLSTPERTETRRMVLVR
jgi:hypothetical protein